MSRVNRQLNVIAQVFAVRGRSDPLRVFRNRQYAARIPSGLYVLTKEHEKVKKAHDGEDGEPSYDERPDENSADSPGDIAKAFPNRPALERMEVV